MGKEVWRSVEEGPHVPFFTLVVTDGTQTRHGVGYVAMTIPINSDIERMKKNEIIVYEISWVFLLKVLISSSTINQPKKFGMS